MPIQTDSTDRTARQRRYVLHTPAFLSLVTSHTDYLKWNMYYVMRQLDDYPTIGVFNALVCPLTVLMDKKVS